MKQRPLTKTLTLLALAAGSGYLLVACKTAGYQQADKTGEGIASYRQEILDGKNAIDKTMASLDAIAATATTNPRPAFEQYSKDVSNLESVANKIRKRGEDMRAKGQAYFAQWQQQLAQVKNPEIQQLGRQQKEKLQTAFDNIKTVAEPLKTQFAPWMSNLKDLQTYLSNDLTVNGVDAAKSLFRRTHDQGQEVQKSMDALIAELNTISATFTPANITTNAQASASGATNAQASASGATNAQASASGATNAPAK